MSSGNNPNNRRRVRSNQLVGEIPRAAGTKGAAQATSALGSLYGRSNVHVEEPKEQMNLWGNLSKTLGTITTRLYANRQEEDAEAKRLRLKQEALEEERQRLMGRRMGNEINRTLVEGVVTGGIADTEEADKYAFDMLDQVAPVMGTPFYNEAYAKITDGLDFVGTQFNKKIEAEYLTTTRTTITQSMNHVLLNTQNNTPDERKSTIENCVRLGVQAGLSLQQVHSDVFSSYRSNIRALALGGRYGEALTLVDEVMASGLAASMPPDANGMMGAELVSRDFWGFVDDADRREQAQQQKDRTNKTVEQDANFGTLLVNIAQATDLNQLQLLRDKLQGMPTDDVVSAYGTSAGALWKSLAAQEDYLLAGKTPLGNREAILEIEDRMCNSDYALIFEPTAINDYADRLTPIQLSGYRSALLKLRNQQDPDEVTMVNSTITRLNAYFNPADDRSIPPPYAGLQLMGEELTESGQRRPSMTQAGFAVREIMNEELRKVNPKDYQDDPIGLRTARLNALQTAEDRIKSGTDRRFLEVANANRRLDGQPELKIESRYYDFDRDLRDDMEARENLVRAVLKPSARETDIISRIKRFDDPKVRNFLSLRYQASVVAQKLATASRELVMANNNIDRLTAEWEPEPVGFETSHGRDARRMRNLQRDNYLKQWGEQSAKAQDAIEEALEWQETQHNQFASSVPLLVDDPTAAAGIVVNSLPPREETK